MSTSVVIFVSELPAHDCLVAYPSYGCQLLGNRLGSPSTRDDDDNRIKTRITGGASPLDVHVPVFSVAVARMGLQGWSIDDVNPPVTLPNDCLILKTCGDLETDSRDVPSIWANRS